MSEIPKQLSKNLRINIVKNMFLGYSRDSIAKGLRVSSGTVSNVWREFKSDAQKIGLSKAEKAYDLEEEIENLRILSVDLHNASTTVDQSLSARVP